MTEPENPCMINKTAGKGVMGMGGWTILVFLALPILLIVGIYRLMARLTSRSTKHGIDLSDEGNRGQNRIFRD